MWKYLKLQAENPQEAEEVEEDLALEVKTEKEVKEVEIDQGGIYHLHQKEKVAVELQERKGQKEESILLKQGSMLLQKEKETKLSSSLIQNL